MAQWICKTCGVQYTLSQEPPETCLICSDQRQYIGYEGQQWTTLTEMQKQGYHNKLREHEPHLFGIGTTPKFGIGQRALLVQSEHGNVLWDCISYLDEETVGAVEQLGGLTAIAISHPHFYATMVEWAERFNVPIYLHEADRQWVMRPSKHIQYWSAETHSILHGITLIRLGGHFAGSTVLHRQRGDAEDSILLTGDTIQVAADRQ